MSETSLSFSTSLPPFLVGSLTSLIYGEQSEKSSPSEISLEVERRDKVSAGNGLGPKGPLPRGRLSWLTESQVLLQPPQIQFSYQKYRTVSHT